MLQLRRALKPEIVFVHTPQDIHQDHVTVTQEALRAFRGTTVLGYDVLRSSYGFFPHFLVEVTEAAVNKKIEALAKYVTYTDRYYFSEPVLRSTAIRHGASPSGLCRGLRYHSYCWRVFSAGLILPLFRAYPASLAQQSASGA